MCANDLIYYSDHKYNYDMPFTFFEKKYYITDMYIVIMSLWSMIVNIFARLYVQQPRFGARKKLFGLIILYILFVKSERSTI